MINKIIVTTTINSPTKAIHKFCALPDWTLIVVGDQKTPHEEFKDLDCIYLSPTVQDKKYPELSQAIGWNCIQRRNIGFVEAYRSGADIVASVDDDMNYCGVGRYDDILGGYFVQLLFPRSLIYNKASVEQERNHHDIFSDLEQELYGYNNTMKLLSKWGKELNKADPVPTGIPEHSVDLYSLYRKHFV